MKSLEGCVAVITGAGSGFGREKFPDTREFTWRPVRSALRRQPASPALRETTPISWRNARQWRAFADWRPVSRLRI